MANELCLQYGSWPKVKRVYMVAICLLVPYAFATSHPLSHSGQMQPTSCIGKSYIKICMYSLTYLQVIYILCISDPPDNELQAIFEQFSQEKSRRAEQEQSQCQ